MKKVNTLKRFEEFIRKNKKNIIIYALMYNEEIYAFELNINIKSQRWEYLWKHLNKFDLTYEELNYIFCNKRYDKYLDKRYLLD